MNPVRVEVAKNIKGVVPRLLEREVSSYLTK